MRVGHHAARNGVFGSPLRLEDAVIAVLLFFSRDVRQEDEEVQILLAGVGSQIGQFLQRARSEAERAQLLLAERAAREET
jgi:GAF domain-containing protein